VYTEVAAALCNVPTIVTGHVAGIGGRDITPEHMREMYGIVKKAAIGEKVRPVTWHGLRGIWNERDADHQGHAVNDMFVSGHGACAGCGMAVAVKNIMRILGADTTVYVPASCLIVISAMYPTSNFRTPYLLTAFENTGAVATGIRARRGGAASAPSSSVLLATVGRSTSGSRPCQGRPSATRTYSTSVWTTRGT
jgi:hypothetical protein